MLLTMNASANPWNPQGPGQKPTSSIQYTDFSHVPDSVSSFCADDAGRKSMEQFFPVKLHMMLSELEKDGKADVVGWSPHGRAFHVHKQEKFVTEVIPKWFRQTGYASFRRQLNLYGFRRITTGRDKGAYWHELFLRGKCFLADRMERVKLIGPVPKGRKRNAPESEPNFYIMKPLPPSELSGSRVASKAATVATTSSLPSNTSFASSTENNSSVLSQAASATAIEILQQQCLQNAYATSNWNGILSGATSTQLTDAQLAQLVRPLLVQQVEQQQHVQDLETQLLIQEQIKILRARLLAQLLSRA